MVIRIDRIVTRGGDKGETSLGDGKRVGKDDPRIEAYGAVDEANAAIGVLRLQCADRPETNEMLVRIQNDLFDLGADLCVPGVAGERLRLTAAPSTRLEAEIAALKAHLEPLTSFVIPGGTPASAYAHLARTIVRRAERAVVALAANEAVNGEIIRYLNRLSDHLFVLGRALNEAGELVWVPGGADSPKG